MPLTRSQIERLGQRLSRSDSPDLADLELLDEFEQSFQPAQDCVVRTIRTELRLNPTARRKSRRSIVAKIRRQHTALPRMQDIAGCRLIVEDALEQEEVLERLLQLPWEASQVDDRRLRPSHGYRAVHVIVTAVGHPVEIQIRTALQDLWAQISEKMADQFGLDVKYGGGPERVKTILTTLSGQVSQIEEILARVEERRRYQPDRGPEAAHADADLELEALQSDIRDIHSDLRKHLNDLWLPFRHDPLSS